jgi:arylsulfatase A-like enzyme
VPGLDAYHGTDTFLTEALTLEANQAVDRAVEDGTPFYLYMSHYAVHAPWEKDDRFYGRYVDAGLSEADATYASMIEGMDKSLGDILANLRRHGIADDTVVIFMSDNGAAKNVRQNAPLRGHKIDPYEGGVRVPLLVKWPGVAGPGSVCDGCTMVEDLFPTLLEMAGVDAPKSVSSPVDGVSFVPLLKDPSRRTEPRLLVWHYPHTYDRPPYTAARKGDWKIVYFHEDRRLELYNIAQDIGEQRDLLAGRPDVAGSLIEDLRRFLVETEAQMPTYRDSRETVPLPTLGDG